MESFKLPNSPFGRKALAIKPRSLGRRKAKRGSLCRENSIKNTIQYKNEYYYSGINPTEFRGHRISRRESLKAVRKRSASKKERGSKEDWEKEVMKESLLNFDQGQDLRLECGNFRLKIYLYFWTQGRYFFVGIVSQ